MTTSSTNYTGLYSGNVSTAIPNNAYGNANVVSLLAAGTDGANTIGNITAGGNVSIGGDLSVAGTIYGANIAGNIVVPGANTQVLYNLNGNVGANTNFTFNAATATMSVNGNIAGGNVTATGNITGGNVSATGNIAGQYILGNGSQLTGLPASYGNANVSTLLAGFGSNSISTTGNVTASYFAGDGSQLTNINAGNIVGTYGNANVASFMANYGSNTISSTGNITGGNIAGNGSALSAITGANVTGTVANATYATSAGTATSATTAGTVTSNAQANITSVGTLTGLNSTGNISTTGNITGNYIFGNGSQLTGLSATYSNANVASFMANFGSNTISTTGNVTAGNVISPTVYASNITGAVGQNVSITADGTGDIHLDADSVRIGDNGVDATIVTHGTGDLILRTHEGDANQGNIRLYDGANGNIVLSPNGTGQVNINAPVSASGNVSGNYFIGNGSQLTGIATSYGNANVATFMANFGSNTISTTGNITGGYFIGNGSQLTGISSNVSVPGSNTQIIFNDSGAFGATSGLSFNKTSNALATTGTVSAAGNITSGGVGSFATITTSSNADIGGSLQVTGQLDALGSLVQAGDYYAQGNITGGGNVQFSGFMTSQSYISAVGNISGNYFIGNGSLLTGVQSNATTSIQNGTSNVQIANVNGNVTVAVGGTTRATFANTLTTIVGNTTIGYDLDIGNSSYVPTAVVGGTLSVGVGAGAGTISAAGNITSAANIAANYFVGNGSALAGVVATPAGPNLSLQFNQAGSTSGEANVSYDYTTGTVRLAGLTIGSTFAPTAPANINTPTAWAGGYANTNALGNGQILVGNAFFGNTSALASTTAGPRGAKVMIWDAANVTEPASGIVRYNGLTVQAQAVMSNVANASSLVRGGIGAINIGGGTSANTWSATGSGPGAVVGWNQAAFIGQPSTLIPMGNITLSGAAASYAQLVQYAGSNTGNGVASYAQITNNGNITNMIGVSTQFTGTATTTPTNVFGFYMPNTTSTFGFSNSNTQRAATNYYFLRNDDPVAQVQLGTLRSYNEFNYVNPTTSGALTIDKFNAQVQQVNLAGNISGITYANLVTSLSDSVNTDEQVDTVTIIFNQGTTGGYGVTFPSGSNYKYANGVNYLQSVAANSVSLVSVTATRISGTTTYLTTISPGFV